MIPEYERERLKLLANGLILFGMDEDDALLIIQMMVGKSEKREMLLSWMADHPYATPSEISDRAVKFFERKAYENIKNPAVDEQEG